MSDPLAIGTEAVDLMTRCPDCQGDGWVNVFVIYTDQRDRVISETSKKQACLACLGTGRRSDDRR